MKNILMFRVSTTEILEELKWRTIHSHRRYFDEFSSEQLLNLIITQRMDSFGNT